MKICAVVLNYRNARQTEACLASLNGQGLEMVQVIDNSALDHYSAELSAMIVRMGSMVDYRLHLVNPGQNLGFARGVNQALSDDVAGHFDAFMLINNDAVALPGMAESLARALVDTGSTMVAPTVIDSTGVVQPMLWYQRFFGLLTTHQLPGSFPYLSGCCLLIRREMLQGGRLFDEDFFMYGEDTLLGWHMTRSGGKAGIAKEAIVCHDSGGSSRQCQLFYEYHTAHAHVLLAIKARRTMLEVPLLLITKFIGLGFRALLRSVRCGNTAPIRAFVLAWFSVKIRTP